MDASVVIDAIAPDVMPRASALRTLTRLSAERAELVGPRLILTESTNALLMGIRKGRWTGAAADMAHALLMRLPLKLADEAVHLDRAWELSRRYDNHPVYDMVYVAVAEAAGTDLITADERLRSRLRHLGWVIAPDV